MTGRSEEHFAGIPAPWGGVVTLDDLNPGEWPPDLQDMVYVIGMPNTIALCQRFGGCQLYIPLLDRLLKPVRDEAIRKQFTGSNLKELSGKFRMSTSAVRTVLSRRE